jgi:hypothetical protein
VSVPAERRLEGELGSGFEMSVEVETRPEVAVVAMPWRMEVESELVGWATKAAVMGRAREM